MICGEEAPPESKVQRKGAKEKQRKGRKGKPRRINDLQAVLCVLSFPFAPLRLTVAVAVETSGQPMICGEEAPPESKVQRKGTKEKQQKGRKGKREESKIFKLFFAFFLFPLRLCV